LKSIFEVTDKKTCAGGIAGLYYLHDKDGNPRKSIPEEVAHADPSLAERFGYTAAPYHGYHFYLCDKELVFDKERSMAFGKKTYNWSGGSFESAYQDVKSVMAVPLEDGFSDRSWKEVRKFKPL